MGHKEETSKVQKHKTNVTTNVSTNITIMLPKNGPQTSFFCVFWGPHPRMVSKASPDRLQDPKACQNGGLAQDFLLFCFKYLILFGGILEMIRAKFVFVFV